MKGIVQTAYGSPDGFELRETARPVVKDGDVLVRVHAAALHAGDTGWGRPERADLYSADIVATLARLLARDTGNGAPSSAVAVKASTSHR